MPRPRQRDAERAEELDRDRDAERDPRDRLEERHGQHARADAERDGGSEILARASAEHRARERPQDQRGEREPQRHEAGGPEPIPQRLRQRGA